MRQYQIQILCKKRKEKESQKPWGTAKYTVLPHPYDNGISSTKKNPS